ncbi:TraR/DksA C4-type zinc finger protein [Paenibacillus sacheonensis]|uniref:Conjugal transfer protein TraR n=1 Tax=Paenibacillus sacheonensis TaxID=742054 RepID=A0A7X4YL58_9BACL|nr:TraR/DksA C4-type zinc finger protein [Paenibacillus sacheonensis]MBM7563113.1 YteA family regulatory protein [Paenibacillus sacheonensis]NBC68320.1 conjugal transfer protein TraR [Paenibacillus sacheonensis]
MTPLTQHQSDELTGLLRKEHRELMNHFENERSEGSGAVSETVSTGELSAYDNHPGDLGTETFERERDMAIDEHLNEQLEEVEAALGRLSDGSYGICETCGEPIPFERLKAVPTASRCIEHASDTLSDERPVEEQVMTRPPSGAGAGRQANAGRFDEADAWESLEEYGNASGTVNTGNQSDVENTGKESVTMETGKE